MTPAVDEARNTGIHFELAEYEHDPRADSYGMEAADAMGVPTERVFKTLVAQLDDDRLAVAIVPVSGQLDLKALAKALDARRAQMADPIEAQRVTGYLVGGISPLGQKRRLPTALDESALLQDAIYVSAGRRGLDMKLAPADLQSLTNAVVAPIARN
jgi:Cys-tRNA(Pro)/Cys-tRNA(Cys) deacylase